MLSSVPYRRHGRMRNMTMAMAYQYGVIRMKGGLLIRGWLAAHHQYIQISHTLPPRPARVPVKGTPTMDEYTSEAIPRP